MRYVFVCLLVSVVVMSVGCVPSGHLTIAPLRPIAETPAANLPVEMRWHNWVSHSGSGSCVNASSCDNFEWAGMPGVAKWWRKNHAGGETDASIRKSHDAVGQKYFYTRSAGQDFLRWVTKTRRSALIWYYQSHCINFNGFHRDPSSPHDQQTYAWLCDNNRPSKYIKVPVDEFLRNWAGYGGFGLSLQAPPVPPVLYTATRS